jgi:hypothetical protein
MGPLGPITVAVLSIGAVWFGDLQARVGIELVGKIDPGLPAFTVRLQAAP